MIRFIKQSLYTAGYFMMACLFYSCLEVVPAAKQDADQLFRPVLFTANVSGNTVEFDWIAIRNATYVLEISRDSLKFERDLVSIPLEHTSYHLVEDLWSGSTYSARIKSVSQQSGIKDSDYSAITFVTGVENIFYAMSPGAIASDHVLLSWDASNAVTRVEVLSSDQSVREIMLTPSDITAGKLKVSGLQSKTDYNFKIYDGERVKGTLAITTL